MAKKLIAVINGVLGFFALGSWYGLLVAGPHRKETWLMAALVWTIAIAIINGASWAGRRAAKP